MSDWLSQSLPNCFADLGVYACLVPVPAGDANAPIAARVSLRTLPRMSCRQLLTVLTHRSGSTGSG